MRTAVPTRSKALLLGASVLALATSWQHPARADINVTGTSAAVTITSGNLANSGTISSSTFIAAVNASGSVGTIANTGTIKLAGPYVGLSGVGMTIQGATIAGTYQPATIGLLSNGAGATILGGASGVRIDGATIGTIANSGTITTSPSYGAGAAISAAAQLWAGSGLQTVTVGTLTNNAGGVIGGGINFAGSTIGTLVNSGQIIAQSGFGSAAITLGSATLYSSTFNGSIYTTQSIVALGGIGTIMNNAGGTIAGDILVRGSGATIGIIDNAGLITGSITGTQATIGSLHNEVGGSLAGVTLTGGSIGSFVNSGTIAPAPNSYVYSGAVNLGASSVYTGSDTTVVPSNIGIINNQAGATIAGGLQAQGATIGTFTNAGGIGGGVNLGAYNNFGSNTTVLPSSIGTINNQAGATIAGGLQAQGATIGTFNNAGGIGGGVNLGAYNNFGFNTTVLPSSIGTINNQAGGTITGGLAAVASSIGAFNNAGLISGGVNLGAAIPYTYSSSGTGYTYIYGAVTSTIGQLTNAAGATITGGSGLTATGASIGTLTNAGMIQGSVNLGGASTSTFSSNGTTYSSTYSSVDSTIGTLINKANASITGGVYIGGTVGTFDNAGMIGSIGTYTYNSYGLSFGSNSKATLINNETGATIAGFAGLNLSGTDVGTLSNSGLIESLNNTAITGGLKSSYNSVTSSYAYSAASIGTLTNAAGGTIQGYYGGIQYQGSIGTLINDGLIATESGSGVSIAGNGATAAIGTLINGVHGTISSLYYSGAIAVSGATITALQNDGLVSGGTSGSAILVSGNSFYAYDTVHGTYGTTYFTGQINTISNSGSGSITGSIGINVYGDSHVGTLSNDGLIQGSTAAGIALNYNYNNGTLTPHLDTLLNNSAGTITGNTAVYIESGTLGTLVNNGLISGTLAAINGQNNNFYLSTSGQPSISTLVNTGIITATGTLIGTVTSQGAAISITGINLGTLSNNGLVSGTSALVALGFDQGTYHTIGTIGLIENLSDGTLIGTGQSAAVSLQTNVDTIRNAGLITQQGTGTVGAGIAVSGGTVGTLWNQTGGTINGTGSAVELEAVIDTLGNSGLLQGGVAGIRLPSVAISIFSQTASAQTSSIGAMSNTGTIAGGVNGIDSAGQIGVLTNGGSIMGSTGAGISNVGSVYNLSITEGYFPIFNGGTTITRTVSSAGGTIGTLANSGTIAGGQSGIVNGLSSAIQTVTTSIQAYQSATTVIGTTGPIGGTIGTLMNSGTIRGVAGAGIDNGAATAVIGTIVNSGLVQGGQTGLINAGTIGTLTNSGTITGAVAAIRDSGTLGPVTNTGVIAGDIVHTAASDLSITGGSGTTFGTLTGVNGARGTLSSTAGNVTLAGNLVLSDSVSIAGHTLVENGGSLVLTAPTTITGNYAQTGGTLTAMAVGGTVGGLQVSGSAGISGATVVLTSQYAYGLTSGASYTIVAAGDAASSYASVTALAPGYNSTTVTSTVVGGQTDLIVSVGNSSLSAGGTATIAGGAGALDQMTGGALAITGGTPTVGSIAGGTLTQTSGSASLGTVSGGTIALGGGSATLGTIAGGTLTQTSGSASLGTVSGGTIALAGGSAALGTIAGGTLTQTSGSASLGTVSGGTIALGGGSATLGTIAGGTLTQTSG
ncbi:beta strand repeat-containing protein, partial [Nitrospirillum amazonense]|uniref:beta strand repeat-containing protein n=1 Tax=Nitrospirillum amazonense TaxID=28077 RepID=UPI001648512D